MIRLSCPSCKKTLRSKDAGAGRNTRCPNCKAFLSIPASSQTSDELADVKSQSDVELVPTDAIQAKSRSYPQADPTQQLACPLCSQPILADPRLAGQTVTCPHCHGIVQMPPSPNPVPAPVVPVSSPTITFRCPHCQSQQTFTMEFAGQVIKCPSCNLPVQVPAPQGQSVGGNITVNFPTPPSHTKPTNDLDFSEPLISLPRRSNHGNGVVALILGLIAFFLFPLLGPVAIIVGSSAMRDDPNDGCAKAGYILGWIVTACLLACLLALVFMFCLNPLAFHSGRR